MLLPLHQLYLPPIDPKTPTFTQIAANKGSSNGNKYRLNPATNPFTPKGNIPTDPQFADGSQITGPKNCSGPADAPTPAGSDKDPRSIPAVPFPTPNRQLASPPSSASAPGQPAQPNTVNADKKQDSAITVGAKSSTANSLTPQIHLPNIAVSSEMDIDECTGLVAPKTYSQYRAVSSKLSPSA
jgi:hypothetical protein